MLIDKDGNFRVPTLFVTNASNWTRGMKARSLSHMLGFPIREEQMVMGHSPLELFTQFHERHVYAIGQRHVSEIVEDLGFRHVSMASDLSKRFPCLDVSDSTGLRLERAAAMTQSPSQPRNSWAPIEAVVLLAEPTNWESHLQLLMDILLTHGRLAHMKQIAQHGDPFSEHSHPDHSHLPILACNTDLLWMAEAAMPRLGHGCFLRSFEALYEKLTGRGLEYTALIGKPSAITYLYAVHKLSQLHMRSATGRAAGPLRRIYAVGDNPDSDIYGANLYNRLLQREARAVALSQHSHTRAQARPSHSHSHSPSQTQSHFVTPSAGVHIAPAPTPGPLGSACFGSGPGPGHMMGRTGTGTESDDVDTFVDLIREGWLARLANQSNPLAQTMHSLSHTSIQHCQSILVCTGLYKNGNGNGNGHGHENENENRIQQEQVQEQRQEQEQENQPKHTDRRRRTHHRPNYNHNHPNFPDCAQLRVPDHTVDTVFDAVQLAFQKEQFHAPQPS